MSEQEIREAFEDAYWQKHYGPASNYPDAWHKVAKLAWEGACDHIAALASSPSEPLVEVEDLASMFYNAATFLVNTGLGYKTNPRFFDECKGDISALITARDAQVAARVREENKALREALQSLIDAVASCEKNPSERQVELLYGTCAESRAALTATGGGE